MPAFSRKGLRQQLGRAYLGDYVDSNTSATINAATVGGVFTNVTQFGDTTLSGQGLYENAIIRHLGTGGASGLTFDYRVASFNAGSGAFVTGQVIQATVNYNDIFEIHTRVSPTEKDRSINDTITEIRVRQEVGIMTVVDGDAIYSIEGAASPHYVSDVLDCYYFSSPLGSLDRGQKRFVDFQIVPTGTGRELRITPALAGSQQIVLDAILEMTLTLGQDTGIILPDQDWILSGAAAKCYNFMIQNAPGQNAGELVNRRTEWARKFSRLSANFAPYPYDRKIRLGETDF